jgi:LmbE family N-acetylglucosaminyl deacetylase
MSEQQAARARFPSGPVNGSAVIVAHPDDETLWAGGLLLSSPEFDWIITTLCRGDDPDRSPKFFRALERYGATGAMADLDDGPQQTPIPDEVVRRAVLELVPNIQYQRIVTHAPKGEYTRHRRHEEVSHAVMGLWKTGTLQSKELWLFAYDDAYGRSLPQPVKSAHLYNPLSRTIWQEKYHTITDIYGFPAESWEARATPQAEAFWRFRSPEELLSWQMDHRITR